VREFKQRSTWNQFFFGQNGFNIVIGGRWHDSEFVVTASVFFYF
jgi:hypothetical protein